MKKNQNIWIAAGLLTIAMFIATIYCILVYRDSVIIIGISSLLFLGSAFWLFICISKIISNNQSAQPSVGEEQRERMNYEGMKLQGEELIRLVNMLGKGTYINSKRSAEHLEKLLTQYIKTQQENEQLIRTLIEEQTNTAKFQVKYNQNDTRKVIAALNDRCSQLNESLSQCVTAIQSKTLDIPAPQDNNQVSESLHTLSLELAQINSSIQALQMQFSTVSQLTSVPAQASPIHGTESEIQPAVNVVEPMISAEKPAILDESSVVSSEEPAILDESSVVEEETTDIVSASTSTMENAAIVNPEPVSNGLLDQSAIDAMLADVNTEIESITEEEPAIMESEEESAVSQVESEESTPDVSSIVSDDPNKQLSPDEIAALFAALG